MPKTYRIIGHASGQTRAGNNDEEGIKCIVIPYITVLALSIEYDDVTQKYSNIRYYTGIILCFLVTMHQKKTRLKRSDNPN